MATFEKKGDSLTRSPDAQRATALGVRSDYQVARVESRPAGSGSEPGRGKGQAAPGLRSPHASQRAGAAGRGWVTPGAWAATLPDPVPPSLSQPTLPRERPRSLSQSAPRREEAAPGDWGHFVLAGAGVTRWRHRRSDGFPPGRSRWQWWQPYRRPNSPRPFPSPRRRRERETAATAQKASGRASAAATTLH